MSGMCFSRDGWRFQEVLEGSGRLQESWALVAHACLYNLMAALTCLGAGVVT